MRWYVPSYMATACAEENQPSVSGYKTYARNSHLASIGPDSEAVRAIQAIDAAHYRWKDQSLDVATQLCFQTYVYPESVSDATPAVELYLASSLPTLSSLVRDSFESTVRQRASGWFNQTNTEQPYISWLYCCVLGG